MPDSPSSTSLQTKIQARLSEDLAERLQRQAERRFQPLSVILREAVLEHIKRLEREERAEDTDA